MVHKYSWSDVVFVVAMLASAIYLAPTAPYTAAGCAFCAGNQLQIIISAIGWQRFKAYGADCPRQAAAYLLEQLYGKP